MLKYVAAGLLIAIANFAAVFGASVQPPAGDEAAGVFDSTKVHTVHVIIAAKEWVAMQPAVASTGVAASAATGSDYRFDPFLRADSLSPAAGDFPYVRADLEFDGENCKDIGIRYKGSSSYRLSASGLKHSLKVDFNRFVDERKFFGLTALDLNNNAMDPSSMRESLAYSVFRQAGIVASRTAYAKVYLSVPGQYNREYLGL